MSNVSKDAQAKITKAYKEAEKNHEYGEAAVLRSVLNQGMKDSNAGHGFYAHKMLEKAYENNQLSPIGQFLGPGPNPFKGADPKAAFPSAFLTYTVKNGVVYLGDKPY
jgi:hypothetical protein